MPSGVPSQTSEGYHRRGDFVQKDRNIGAANICGAIRGARKARANDHQSRGETRLKKMVLLVAKNGTVRIADACRTRFSASLGSEVPSAFRISLLR